LEKEVLFIQVINFKRRFFNLKAGEIDFSFTYYIEGKTIRYENFKGETKVLSIGEAVTWFSNKGKLYVSSPLQSNNISEKIGK